jgi:hypothetical protein
MPSTSHAALRCKRVFGAAPHVVAISHACMNTFPCQREGKPAFVKPTR